MKKICVNFPFTNFGDIHLDENESGYYTIKNEEIFLGQCNRLRKLNLTF